MSTVVELGNGRCLADLGFRDTDGLIASYFLPQSDGWTLVETGPSTCLADLLGGLSSAGIAPEEVRRVFVTHIHLDHSGGLGRVAAALPNAQLFAHRLGVPHLVDPSRLVASARRAWGPASDTLWGTILPVPASRLVALDGGEEFPVTGGTLKVLATPGHARHHLCFLDSATGALMTGDGAGVRLQGGWRPRPAVPAPDLDLEALFDSLARMADANPQRVWYSHFGESPDGARDLGAYRRAVEEWRDAALGAARTDASIPNVARALEACEREAARAAGARLPEDDPSEFVS
ncbi:MAG TPA: MBL fold metallo-hydrolase, partial [Thermoplasmata archaeon]|nr:MBL fold metallo-hydrolase [Thermoplasmata archaeon]